MSIVKVQFSCLLIIQLGVDRWQNLQIFYFYCYCYDIEVFKLFKIYFVGFLINQRVLNRILNLIVSVTCVYSML